MLIVESATGGDPISVMATACDYEMFRLSSINYDIHESKVLLMIRFPYWISL